MRNPVEVPNTEKSPKFTHFVFNRVSITKNKVQFTTTATTATTTTTTTTIITTESSLKRIKTYDSKKNQGRNRNKKCITKKSIAT